MKDRATAGDVITLIQGQGFGIVDVSTRDPDLEDVFPKLTRAAARVISSRVKSPDDPEITNSKEIQGKEKAAGLSTGDPSPQVRPSKRYQAKATSTLRRRTVLPTIPKPKSIIAQVAGSGTAAIETLSTAKSAAVLPRPAKLKASETGPVALAV